MGAYSFMLMNFDLVKWRLASLKPIQRQHQEVIQEQNAVMPMLLKWYLIKIYLDKKISILLFNLFEKKDKELS
jgi:hypothetical protein